MSEKRFTYGETIDYNFFDVFEEKKYLGMVQRDSTKIVDRLNEQQAEIDDLEEENEKLRKQIQNYEKLLANSYVGEEERLDGFFGRYVIWEDELQKCKNKNEMIE